MKHVHQFTPGANPDGMLWKCPSCPRTRNFQACSCAVNLLASVIWDVEGVMHIKFCTLWHTAMTPQDCLQEQIWTSVMRCGASSWRCNATWHPLDERFIVVISVGSSGTSTLLPWPFPARLPFVLATEETFWRSSSSFLPLLPRIPVSSVRPFIFPTITHCRMQFLHKIWPIF